VSVRIFAFLQEVAPAAEPLGLVSGMSGMLGERKQTQAPASVHPRTERAPSRLRSLESTRNEVPFPLQAGKRADESQRACSATSRGLHATI
jgi:hypothetical protein